jgi:hypothetical protein
MRWRPHIDRSARSHCLQHLHPFRFTLELNDGGTACPRTVTVHVGFGIHCFTRKYLDSECDAEPYRDDREIRAFDKERYELSKELPTIVRTLCERRCGFGKHENYVTLDLSQAGAAYAVFFQVKRWRKAGPSAVLVVVQSAYRLDPGKRLPSTGRISFNALVGHALRETRPKIPR